MVLRVGLTGGIGSGKSTAAKIFEVLSIPVYYADVEAKRLMNEDLELRTNIIKHFGEKAYTNEMLDRKYISSIVFSDPAKLELLNSIVHPATKEDGEKWMHQQTTPYAIHEAALIFESGSAENLDYVIGVSAPRALRIQRVMNRDGITRDEVVKRINRQIDETIKMKLCDFVIINDEQQLLVPQVLGIHEKLLELSKSK